MPQVLAGQVAPDVCGHPETDQDCHRVFIIRILVAISELIKMEESRNLLCLHLSQKWIEDIFMEAPSEMAPKFKL